MTIRIMPPGAANLPVRFLVVPDNKLQPIREAVQAERTAKENGLLPLQKQLNGKPPTKTRPSSPKPNSSPTTRVSSHP